MLKNSLKRAIIRSGFLRVASRFVGDGVAIVMYHSVQDDPSAQFDLLGGIIHSTEVFRGQMEVVARHFNPVTLNDVLWFVNGEKELPPRPVVVTFDDGYADNYQVAKQVLDQVGVPAAFYVVVESIDRQVLPWPIQLRSAFLTANTTSWHEPGGTVWPLDGREHRLLAFEQAAGQCAKLSGDLQRTFLDSVRRDLQAQPSAAGSLPAMMSWNEIRAMVQGGHIVGSHTMTHPNMAYITAAEAETEFSESKRRLEQELGGPVVHFSYPCPALQPHWAEQTVTLSRKAGYVTSVTTNGGLVKKGHDPLKLRRIRPTKNVPGFHWNLERTFAGAVV